MNRNWMILFLLILFFIEGSVVPHLIPDGWYGRIAVQFVFVVVLFHGVYAHRHTALLMGLGFGLLHDIVYYGQIIGPHSFTMGFLGYLAGYVFNVRHKTMVMMLFVVLIGSFLYQTIIFGIYTLFSLSHFTYQQALLDYIIPSMFVQLIFALIVYVPLRKWFDMIQGNNKKDSEEA
ncbi:rod shape-determining protein MreD [Paenibacillus sp. SC116]|uniref:rod shape-determining protein MreD n=1 Tax=Paenibacillus sp. SC116 TaxID=2968986 RepID=UPI00215A3E21|nr:rod shape-determining protein MreD [Paenibacillus sp. SC116]MCR8846251.1 rod shape-determining protein MreD [Paenibacillus sp. SC116]